MVQITVTIDGRNFRMACDDGEEERLQGLAKRFDDSINALRGSFGEIGNQRLTVMAGIMAMDQLVETERRLVAMQDELDALKAKQDQADDVAAQRDAALAAKVLKVAERIEGVSEALSRGLREEEVADG